MTDVVAAALALSSVAALPSRGGSARRLRPAPPGVARALAGMLAGVGLAVSFLAAGAPAASLPALCVGLCGLRLLWRGRNARLLHRARADEVMAFCLSLAPELRAGRTPADAIAAAASPLTLIGADLLAAARACRHGASIADELATLAGTAGCDRLRPVASAWSATVASGARAADLVERIASGFAADDAAHDELSAHVAGPQATVAVLAMLPFVAVAFGSALGAHPTAFLLHTTAGWLTLGVATVLDAVGVAWMRRIMRGALTR